MCCGEIDNNVSKCNQRGCENFSFGWYLSGKNQPDSNVHVIIYPKYNIQYRILRDCIIDENMIDSVVKNSLGSFCEVKFILNSRGKKVLNEMTKFHFDEILVFVVNDQVLQLTSLDYRENNGELYYTDLCEYISDIDCLIYKINCRIQLSRKSK